MADVLQFKTKDRTAAERQRRYRERRKRSIVPAVTRDAAATSDAVSKRPTAVTRDAVTPVTATSERYGRTTVTQAVTLFAALGLAACSAGMSVTGLTAIFAGAYWPIVAMGVTFETGKLAAVTYLGGRHGVTALRLALVTLVTAFVTLNSVGVYGFLARAHLRDGVTSRDMSRDTAVLDGKIVAQRAVVNNLDLSLSELHDAIAEATAHGRSTIALTSMAQTARRSQTLGERTTAASVLAELEGQKAELVAAAQLANADHLGPVGYLAKILNTSPDDTMRYFILAVALLLDPAAVLLLLAATLRPRMPRNRV